MGYFYGKKHTLIVFLPVHISLCKSLAFQVGFYTHGDVAEWLKAHSWKGCGRLTPSRGFESHYLRCGVEQFGSSSGS